MKIVCVDSYNRESVADTLVAENIQNKAWAEILINALHATCSNDVPKWYKLVSDDYKLWRGMEELI